MYSSDSELTKPNGLRKIVLHEIQYGAIGVKESLRHITNLYENEFCIYREREKLVKFIVGDAVLLLSTAYDSDEFI